MLYAEDMKNASLFSRESFSWSAVNAWFMDYCVSSVGTGEGLRVGRGEDVGFAAVGVGVFSFFTSTGVGVLPMVLGGKSKIRVAVIRSFSSVFF